MRSKVILGVITMLVGSVASGAQSKWQEKVREELPMIGHRNWIVVVDSAYPLQSSSGVETIVTGENQLAVVDYVLDAVKHSKHVRPLVHLDAELNYVPEQEAPGVEAYRKALTSRLAGIPVDSVLHQTLIDRLHETGQNFHVLILKTNMTIPYTSVFMQLDCRYWSAESEAKLRKAMSDMSGNTKQQ